MRRECSSLTDLFSTIEISESLYEDRNLRIATVRSPALGRRADVTIWAPPVKEISTLLILLHGVYGSHWVWTRKGGVHLTAQRLLTAGSIEPMAIVMPSDGLRGDGSGYLSYCGEKENAEAWIVDEVPLLAQLAVTALSATPRLAIAGLSMGGYGALRLGAKYSQRFSHISAHSAITDIDQMAAFVADPTTPYLLSAPRTELSALHWIRTNREHLPKLRFDCGVDDDLITANRALHSALQQEGINHTYDEFPGGHEWSYWQEHVQKTLQFANEG